jgi:hypothetical protein
VVGADGAGHGSSGPPCRGGPLAAADGLGLGGVEHRHGAQRGADEEVRSAGARHKSRRRAGEWLQDTGAGDTALALAAHGDRTKAKSAPNPSEIYQKEASFGEAASGSVRIAWRLGAGGNPGDRGVGLGARVLEIGEAKRKLWGAEGLSWTVGVERERERDFSG